MKVIILAAGTDGDVHPQMGIGRALVKRGHEVVFFAAADYAEQSRRCGFTPLTLYDEDEKRRFTQEAKGLSPLAKLRFLRATVSAKFASWCDTVAGLLDDETVTVAPPGLSVVTRLIQEKHGTPTLTPIFAPSYLFSAENPPLHRGFALYRKLPYGMRKSLMRVAERHVSDRVFHSVMREPAARMGVPLPRRIVSEWWYSPQKVIGLFADWFVEAPSDWPRQLSMTGFTLFSESASPDSLSPRVAEFLQAGTPPVVFTPGTHVTDCRGFFENALKSLEALGERGIFLTRAADQMPALPPTVLHEPYLPLNLTLPRARALVYHGGIGTMAQALSAGVPQLILPGHSDQFENAWRIERLGCGLSLRQPTPDTLVAKLRELLTDEMAQRCRALQARMDSSDGACGRAAEAVEQLHREARRTVAVPAAA